MARFLEVLKQLLIAAFPAHNHLVLQPRLVRVRRGKAGGSRG